MNNERLIIMTENKLVASYFDTMNTSPDNVVKHYAECNGMKYNEKEYDQTLGQWLYNVGELKVITWFQISRASNVILWEVYKI